MSARRPKGCPGVVTVTDDVPTVSRGLTGRHAAATGIAPLRVGFVSEVSQGGSGDKVALNIEIVVDRRISAGRIVPI